MKTKFLSFVALAASLIAPVAIAQNAPADDAGATDNPEAAVTAAPAPNQTIYVPRLPNAQELSNAAAAQAGVAIDRIEQTDAQVTVVYKFTNGQTNTVAYRLLPAANAAPTTVTVQSPRVVTTTPPPTIVYQTAPRVVYYSDPYYSPYAYYPGYYWPPVSLSLGFGYVWHGGGYYHGGYHRGGGYHHGGHHR